MRLPPWAIEAIRNGVADVARKASDAETISKVKEQAAELLRDLPENASRGIDSIVKSASEKARGALDQGRESILRWKERQAEGAIVLHNVSGVLFSDAGTGVPLSDDVLHAGCDLLRGDCIAAESADRFEGSLSRLLDVGGCDLVVANNFDAAIASLTALAQDRTMVMHRSQAIRLPSGIPLPDALPGVTLSECGGVQRLEADDFDRIATPACVLLADDGEHPLAPLDFGGRDVISVAIVPFATILKSDEDLPSVRSLLVSGVDLVATQGGPLSGTTTSGILAGKQSLIETITKDSRWISYSASAATIAMTAAAVRAAGPHPLSVLIETGEENLRSRAERMATRLTADESIAACQITDNPACLVEGGRWLYPSRQLRLRHKNLSADVWAKQLRNQNPAVLASTDQDDLVIDLRWLPAGNDAFVAESLGSDDDAAAHHAESDGAP